MVKVLGSAKSSSAPRSARMLSLEILKYLATEAVANPSPDMDASELPMMSAFLV
jgi:hypothetical protein